MTRLKLSPLHFQLVRGILRRYVPGIEVRAFGSRVSGGNREWSDLDLVVVSDKPLEPLLLADLRIAFEESELPFQVDVLDWRGITEEFREIISADYEVIQQPEE